MKKILLSVLTVALMATGCTKYLNPEPYFEEYEQEDTDNTIKRKVLFISVDGLVGSEIKQAMPDNLSEMMAHSKYTFESLSDMNTSDPATWATMMTGVDAETHHIISESYLPEVDTNDPHGTEELTPTLFYMIKGQNSKLYTVAVTQSADLSNVLLMDAKETLTASNDEQVRDIVQEKLNKENPDLLVAQFTSVLTAGKGSSFSYSSAAYKEAVQQVDAYIGELKQAVEARDTYEKEDWLIIVTSNHGGTGNSYGGDSYEERNTFSLFYNKNFQSLELSPALINYTNIYQTGSTEATMNGPLLNANSTTEYNYDGTEMTIEFKLKKNVVYNWTGQPFIMGKTARRWSHETGIAGWGIATQSNSLTFYYTFDSGGPAGEMMFNGSTSNLQWQHYALTIRRDGNDVVITAYVDGESPVVTTVTPASEAAAKMVASAAPFYLGVRRSHNASALNREDLSISDLRIYNKALSQAQLRELACMVNTMEPTFESYGNLTADYNLSGLVNGNTIRNLVSGKPDMTTQNSNPLYFGTNTISTPCNSNDNSNVLVNSIDLIPTMLYWLQLDVKDDWGLKGYNFLQKFEIEFIK